MVLAGSVRAGFRSVCSLFTMLLFCCLASRLTPFPCLVTGGDQGSWSAAGCVSLLTASSAVLILSSLACGGSFCHICSFSHLPLASSALWCWWGGASPPPLGASWIISRLSGLAISILRVANMSLLLCLALPVIGLRCILFLLAGLPEPSTFIM